jgi:hypothetical protein
MPWVVRYKDANPRRPYLARIPTGEWGTSVKSRAEQFNSKLAAEKAIASFINVHKAFTFETKPSARKHFVVEPLSYPMLDTSQGNPPRTIWDRILTDD